jgi:hypothetical protein
MTLIQARGTLGREMSVEYCFADELMLMAIQSYGGEAASPVLEEVPHSEQAEWTGATLKRCSECWPMPTCSSP